MKKIVVLSGAGISAESGIKTFRDDDGLWQNHRFEDLATPAAWERNPQLVLDFYNQRRKQLYEVEPNEGHRALAQLEPYFEVQIITQNVDDLHERAGSTQVLHLHGELKKARSSINPDMITPLEGWELKIGDTAADGTQLRPHIVWFGENVPHFERAANMASKADVFIVVGTSLQVYPAAGLLDWVPSTAAIYLVDPTANPSNRYKNLSFMREKAAKGLPLLVNQLIQSHLNTI